MRATLTVTSAIMTATPASITATPSSVTTTPATATANHTGPVVNPVAAFANYHRTSLAPSPNLRRKKTNSIWRLGPVSHSPSWCYFARQRLLAWAPTPQIGSHRGAATGPTVRPHHAQLQLLQLPMTVITRTATMTATPATMPATSVTDCRNSSNSSRNTCNESYHS
jgi:hypothetical protein